MSVLQLCAPFDKNRLQPDEMLFAEKMPESTDTGIRGVADEFVGELREQGIKVAAVSDADTIAEFVVGATTH